MKKIFYPLLCLAITLSLCICLGSCNNEDHQHNFQKTWSFDEDFHWNACDGNGCTSVENKAEHDFEEVDGSEICKSCGYVSELVNTAPEHQCVFATEYSKNDNFHWYACTVEGCTERGERAEHDFAMPEIIQEANEIKRIYTCSLCNHEKTEITVISSVVEGEASWTQAFDNLALTNFEMDVYITDEYGTQHNHCIVTESGAYFKITDFIEYYTVKNADGTCTTYGKQADYIVEGALDYKRFYKLSDTSDKYLTQAQVETVLAVSFADNYDSFTYDEANGAYVCEAPIPTTAYLSDGTPYPEDMYCYDVIVKVADGKISYISAKYYFVYGDMTSEDMGTQSSFVYANIGMCEVTIPQSVILNAIDDPDYELYYGSNGDGAPDYDDEGGYGETNTPNFDSDISKEEGEMK